MPNRSGAVPLDALIAAAGFQVAAGVQVCAPAHADALDPTRPAIVLPVTGVALSPTAFRHYPEEVEVTLLRREREAGAIASSRVTLAQVTAAETPDDVEAIALPAIPLEQIRHDIHGLIGVIARLRDPQQGCPWDLEQDHRSLRPHLLEECYEVLAALDRGDSAGLREELGDLMMQIVLHAQIAQDAGRFDIGEVSERIRAKLIRRHPHVFGGAVVEGAAAVVANWDRLKAAERDADASALEGVPLALPALARAQTLAGRAARRGFAWPNEEAVLEKLSEKLQELAGAPPDQPAEEFGDLLFVIADLARHRGIEAEDALREASAKFERRFRALERDLRDAALAFTDLDRSQLLERWERVKRTPPAPAAGADRAD